ncbi:MAG: thiamine-phosphate synthase family protein [Methanoregula sp.]|nr:thiamine-phosphate synthase family protein [Methanoregula sp.]
MDPVLERREVLVRMEDAVALLTRSMSPQLVPPGGAQIGYAIRGARDRGGIAAVEGKISVTDGGVHPGGPASFGSDEEIARVILTVMKFDPRRRSAAFLRFSGRALRLLDEDLFLECVPRDTAKAPQGISTMDWGVATVCKKGVPDVIYPRDSGGADGTLILLGEDPVDVANNIIICSNRI